MPFRVPAQVVQLPEVFDVAREADSDASVDEDRFALTPTESEDSASDDELVLPDFRLIDCAPEVCVELCHIVAQLGLTLCRLYSGINTTYRPLFQTNSFPN